MSALLRKDEEKYEKVWFQEYVKELQKVGIKKTNMEITDEMILDIQNKTPDSNATKETIVNDLNQITKNLNDLRV